MSERSTSASGEPATATRETPRRFSRSVIFALLIATAVTLVVAATLDDYGLTYDEADFLGVASHLVDWLLHPSLRTIDRQFQYSISEHPPLCGALGGLAVRLLTDRWGILDELSSYRLSALVFVFCLNFALFRFSGRLFGDGIAAFVTLSFSFLPRVFFHAHLGALDYPITAMGFLVLYAYWLGLERRAWIHVAGVLLGLALLTKINALFLYLPIALLWILHRRRPLARDFARRLAPVLVLSPLVFLVGWPWLWPNPIARLLEYFNVFAETRVPTYYFGERYLDAPWHLPFVLAAATVPLVVLAPAILGAFVPWKDRRAKVHVLFNALFPIALIAATPSKHDGVRLILPAFPFLCLSAGGALHFVAQRLRRPAARRAVAAGFVALAVVSLSTAVRRYHPYESSYFNEVMGGVDGAARRGFEVHYWCESIRAVVPWMNDHPESIYHVPACSHVLAYYREQGILDPAVRLGDRLEADRVVLVSRFGIFRDEGWRYYRNAVPEFAVRVGGTSILGVYRLEGPGPLLCDPDY